MPSGPRIRTDNVFGTVSDNPLTNVATTLNSAGLANLAAVSSAHAVIVLDPLRAAGAPEVVFVTAHTGAATSATITRGGYGTSARQHAQGTLWVHAPTIEDVIRIVTSSTRPSDPYRGQLIFETDTNRFVARDTSDAWQTAVDLGAWTSWTPTLTNITVGAGGTLSAKWKRSGRSIEYRWKFVFGSGSAVSGSVSFTLPVAPHADYTANFPMHHSCNMLDAGSTVFLGTTEFNTGSTVTVLVSDDAANGVTRAAISSTNPMTWAAGDTLFVTGSYEAAA